MLNDVYTVARLTRDLPRFLANRMSPEQASMIVRRRLETRPERFIQIAEWAIYAYPKSPYRRLLRAVGCELGDLRDLVAREGVEGALVELAEQGVYVSFAEFKGAEIIRGSERFTPAETDFDNPRFAPHFDVQSGGTRSQGTLVKTSLQFVGDLAADTALALQAHGLDRASHAAWLTGPVLPLLLYAKLGCPRQRWFYPLQPLQWKVRVGGRYLQLMSRLIGCPLPAPVWNDLQNPGQMAERLASGLSDGRSVCVTTYASSAVRVAVAAGERDVGLDGVTFITLGEPFTEAKQRAVEAVGARALVRYAFTEAGILAYRCVEPRYSDDLHFFSDNYGLVQQPRTVADLGLSVQAFLFTSLLPSAPKILLNVESGDHGSFERRDCGCSLGAIGLRDHVGHIRSHEKLSGEGMTFVKTNLIRALEEVLPARFGGSGADYQVVEQEATNGILRLYLLVSPNVGAIDEGEVKQAFLGELGQEGELEEYMARMWERAGTVEVRRQAPIATRVGKVLPFHLIRDRAS